jgi:hypothetical protein
MAVECGRSTSTLVRMISNLARRIRNLLAWVGGAIVVESAVFGIGSFAKPDSDLHRNVSMLVTSSTVVTGPLCGLIGYALVAAFRPSLAGARATFIAGIAFAVAMIAVPYAMGPLLSDSNAIPVVAAVWVGLGGASYLLANRMRSNKERADDR